MGCPPTPAGGRTHHSGSVPAPNGSDINLEVAAAAKAKLEDPGPAPLELQYEVVLSGVTYRAKVSYPDDLDPETTSFHPTFTPPLPGLPDP